MNLFVYTVVHDIGFAPNPFYGHCTLATCKPGIRKHAQRDDWIVGVGSTQKGQEGKLVYAMQVEEKMPFVDYWNSPKFRNKRPCLIGSLKQRYGDNIYHKCPTSGEWMQADSRHSHKDGTPNYGHVKRDTSYPHVLISQKYVYFGADAINIPTPLRSWDGKDHFTRLRSYRRNFPCDLKDALIEWLNRLTSTTRIQGEPLDWNNHPQFVIQTLF